MPSTQNRTTKSILFTFSFNETENSFRAKTSFLIVNGAVLMPTYSQPENDKMAIEAISKAFPGYEVVGIDCVALIKQHGSLHCITMQYPEGVL